MIIRRSYNYKLFLTFHRLAYILATTMQCERAAQQMIQQILNLFTFLDDDVDDDDGADDHHMS